MDRFKKGLLGFFISVVLVIYAIPALAADSWGQVNKGFQATSGEPVTLGNTVCFSGTTIFKADADNANRRPVVGFVERTVGTGTITGVVVNGVLNGQVGLTPGGTIYPSATAGSKTQTAVADYPQILGFAASATSIQVDVKPLSSAIGSITATTGTFSNAINANGGITVAAGQTTTLTNTVIASDFTAAGGRVAIYCYENNNIISSQAAVAMYTSPGGTSIGIPMPYDGSILAASALCNSAITSGSITFDPTVGGTVTGLQAILNTTDTTQDYTTQNKDTDTFSAGDLLGVKHTTPANLAPTTADCRVCITVEY